MEKNTKFELITPSKIVVQQEVEMIVIPGSEGYFGVLPLHANTLSTLNRGIVTLYENDNVANKIIVDGGIADVQTNSCILLVEKAEILDNIDKTLIEGRYQAAKEQANNVNNDTEKKALLDEVSWLKFVLECI